MAADIHAVGDEWKSMNLCKVLRAEEPIISVCYADRMLVAGSDSGNVILWVEQDTTLDECHSFLDLELNDCVNCICYIRNKLWLVGCGSQVVFISFSSGQLVRTHSIELSDEVNSISVNEKLSHAAVADDSGCVTVIFLDTRKVAKKLLGHENICSCVRFRPKCPKSVVSGGLDCILILWDYKTGKALFSLNMADASSKDQDTEQKDCYVVNPPLIHCLDITHDGLVAAAGLENGKVMLLTIGGKSLKLTSIVEAHKQGVSGVSIRDMTMISSGNDSKINVWGLSTARAPGKTLVWATLQHSSLHTGKPSSVCWTSTMKNIIVADESVDVAIYDRTA